MTASPLVLVKDGGNPFVAPTDGLDVTAGNTIQIKLNSTTDVTQWTLQIFGVDETTASAPSLTGVNPTTHVVTTPGTTVSFTMPGGAGIGRALIFRSSVNGGGSGFTTTFGIYALTSTSRRVGAVGERFEGDADFGWTTTVNSIIRAGGGGGGLPPTANEQYAVLMEDPANILIFQRIQDLFLVGGFRAVDDTAQRDAIPVGSRKAGMFVWVQGDGDLYRLDTGLTNGDWVLVPIGGGSTSLQDAYDVSEVIITTDATTPVRIQSSVGVTDQLLVVANTEGDTFYNADRISAEQDFILSTINQPTAADTGFQLTIQGGAGGAANALFGGGSGSTITIVGGAGGVGSVDQPGGTSGNVGIGTNSGGTDNGAGGGSSGFINIVTGEGAFGISGPFGGSSGQVTIATGQGGTTSLGPGGSSGDLIFETGPAGAGEDDGGGAGDFLVTLGNGGSTVSGGGGNGGSFELLAGPGGTSDTGSPGQGGGFTLTLGSGAAGNATDEGAEGGSFFLTTGGGGADGGAGGGTGGAFTLQAEDGGQATTAGAGAGGTCFIRAGQGGDGTVTLQSGDGGSLVLTPGVPGADLGGGPGIQGTISLLNPPFSATSSPELRFYDLDGSHYAGFRAANTTTTSTTYQLPPADGANGDALKTNGGGVLSWGSAGGMGDVQINVTQLVDSASPVTIHTYTDPEVLNRGTICYELLVTAIGPFGGRYAAFKLIAVFERNESTITEQDVTFMNGPVNPEEWDVTFDIDGVDINLQVTGANVAEGVRWRAVGFITVVNATFSEA